MPEKRLLLSPAKSGVLIGESRDTTSKITFFSTEDWRLRAVAVAVGVLMIVVGAADVLGRLPLPVLSEETRRSAFAPGIVALEPQVLSALEPVAPVAPVAPTAPVAAMVPSRLVVTSLGIDAAVERVGVKPDGSMANPSGFRTVGWYQLGAKPGEPGNAVLAGHVNNGLGLSGVFAKLGTIAIGESVVVRSKLGGELTYRVVSKNQYQTDAAPLESIFSTSGPSQLVLVTCEGDWDPESRSYDRRLVVIAELAP